jgi:hypothetical protein
MQVMHDSAPPQIKDVLPQPTIAGTAALPASHAGQGTFNRQPLAQSSTPVTRLLTCAPLLQQCFIGMKTAAETRDTRRAAFPQRTSGIGSPWQLDYPTRRKGHRHTTRTPLSGIRSVRISWTMAMTAAQFRNRSDIGT